MQYNPTLWSSGSKITAEKLNKIENGIANETVASALILTPSTITNTTFNDIYEAYLNGSNIIYYVDDNSKEEYEILSGLTIFDPTVGCYCPFFNTKYYANNAQGYLIKEVGLE